MAAATTEVLRDEPDLAAGLRGELLARARRACVAGVTRVPRGDWDPGAAADPGGFGLLVGSGFLVRRVSGGGRRGAELLGPGDLLRPWRAEGEGSEVTVEAGWSALTVVELSVLDRTFAERAAPFPTVAAQLVARAIARSRRLALTLAIAQQPRVEERLRMLLWSYAARWGRVGPEGTAVEIPLTHALLAELAAARRPTVTTALGRLAGEGRVRREGPVWVLLGDSPL